MPNSGGTAKLLRPEQDGGVFFLGDCNSPRTVQV